MAKYKWYNNNKKKSKMPYFTTSIGDSFDVSSLIDSNNWTVAADGTYNISWTTSSSVSGSTTVTLGAGDSINIDEVARSGYVAEVA